MGTSIWWGPAIVGNGQWQVPDDLWGALLAAHRLLALDPGGIYGSATGLVSFPGAALLLVPPAAVLQLAGIGVSSPGVHNPHPGSWIVAGPYEVAVSASVLFAADALAERSGCSRPKRFVLCAAEAVALWNVSLRWGHPEDAVATALLLFGVLALADGKVARAAWIIGAGIAVQPLVLLAVPIVLAALEPVKVMGFLGRAATPAVVLLGGALAANPSATIKAVGDQPNWPSVDHPTPWTALSPHMSNGAVAAGPGRGLAIVLACVCALVAERSWKTRARPYAFPSLVELTWWIAAALALRCVFESVMVAYYVWPVLAFALCSAAVVWSRLIATAVVSTALTFATQLSWHGAWGWWAMVVGALAVLLVCALGPRKIMLAAQGLLGRPPLAGTSTSTA
jgi:hypothetical protein